MQYSPNGRILEKKHITTNNNANPPFLLPSTTGFTNYEYNNNKVLENDDFLSNFAVDRVYNNYEYDANGNMTKTTKYSLPLMQPSFPAILSSRNLYWNDSDQLQAMADYSNSAHYFYNYAGDRTWKVVGAKTTTTLSGIQRTYNVFNQATYYLFPQVTITNSAYTKHIFAGTERICSKIGTGKSVDMLQLFLPPTAQITAKRSQQTNLMKRTFSNLCIPSFGPPPVFLCAISSGANILNTNLLASSMTKITSTATEPENLQYFYLSDHLGSSSWITDKDGNALQHLSYLPFGEVFANQKASGSSFDAEFKFLGKELDSETGYTKTDNRYYWANAGIFLSVDPLCDKYPMLTPYNYAGNNPLIFKDPSGLDFDPTIDHKNKTITINATYYTSNKNKAHLQKALNAWNEQSGKYYFTPEGSNKEYVINFNLKIAEGNFDTDDDALNAFGSDKSGSANYFQFGEVATNERGHTFDGNQITVSKEAPNRTSSHEVGHTLGIGHFQFGLMETGGNDDKISIGNVANILKTAKFDVKIPEVIRNNQIDNNGGGRAKTTHNIKGRVHY